MHHCACWGCVAGRQKHDDDGDCGDTPMMAMSSILHPDNDADTDAEDDNFFVSEAAAAALWISSS